MLAHESGHAIVNTIMEELGGQLGGADFTKMTDEERSDWAIRFTNTLFGTKDQETGESQYGKKKTQKPSGKLTPIN